ncbi:MAG: hypothetical protein Q8O35_12330 [Humidesulfovibrio sp.]|uniref:hypothetical protein n=1 Tax=Humidesulfovibrio sp. TaxID=2910988 RepID=UPI00273722DF|nr:hypothetical protein [Humidesulfovibrio sp.]MDP2848957.1 hypothetical protein [Humidesulfovibrio sp.]
MTHPTVRNIVAVVRQASPEGCTARYVARICGETIQAVTKALDLQVQAGLMSTEEYFEGERYIGTVYRMRGGK